MAKTLYVRLYADAKGESHFSDEEVELKSVNFVPTAPPLDISAFTPAKHFAFFHAPPGWFGGWHPTPYRQFFFILGGEAEVRASDGDVRRFRPGSVLLLEDTTGRGHTSRITTDDPCIVAVVRLTES
jgi:hypothetical protein